MRRESEPINQIRKSYNYFETSWNGKCCTYLITDEVYIFEELVELECSTLHEHQLMPNPRFILL